MTDEDEDGFGSDWIFGSVPWREISEPGPHTEEPLIDAWWHGTRVTVVAPGVIEEWAATAQAAFFPTADVDAQVIDVPATLAEEGLTGPLPRNALVVKNCAGIQIGNWNKQTNIHKFRVEDVRITLDQALARSFATSVPTPEAVKSRTKVAIWNSRGVQVGDFNRQRNVFRHVVTGPEIALGRGDTAIVDQLRDGQVDAAERALVKLVRREFERDAAQLYTALDVTCNERLPVPPPIVENTFGGEYGLGNEQKVREDITVTGVNATDLIDTLVELLLEAEALKGPSPGEEAVGLEPVDLEPPAPLDLEDIVLEAEPDPFTIKPVEREPIPPPVIDEPARDPWFRW
ncbi:hypothetical protein AMES_1405 [Amycolatopsis mediterranei S699]|uniref:Uncharacterized protein n=2 Tax=Amycolatopsis mediterranei TaxID=33910 RepID=A0A0H3CY05_AMYMU|nr:RIP homotypic interaction motif-containing protein [Amycolatopsis mediterranei]ADJ43228.1 hypothetical protein AMED_1414 [Amycolatopsis mediterranei U32]AEK39926.1 hypothetical protein RAM_07170 [Amycolatopsis mediterranei S699]AFO74941.1 hypothetical protein AMES_1405 [Amycolatopsis mediterranei S699]AGT82070.1 hypothetical protein B737_1406 [Amycolatopsis mediterranei RB]KDO05140.1 hypothetical protein DV26_41070 [Amycolatopsis mediterranei]